MPAIPRIYLHLFSRPVTRVKPQYNLAREVLGLLREEREQQYLGSTWFPELGEYEWEAGSSVGEGEGEIQGWSKGSLWIWEHSLRIHDLTPWQGPWGMRLTRC